MLDDRHYMRRSQETVEWQALKVLLVAIVGGYFVQFVLEAKHKEFISTYFYLSGEGLLKGYVWQLVSHQFLHGSLIHAVFNAVGLYFFGKMVEDALGRRTFIKLYLISGTVGGLFQVAMGWIFPNKFGGLILGASGSVFGVLTAFAYIHWREAFHLMLFFVLPIRMTGRTLFAITTAIAVMATLLSIVEPPARPEPGKPPPPKIAHAAHLGGALAGVAYVALFVRGGIFVLLPRLRSRKRKEELVFANSTSEKSWRKPQVATHDEDLPPEEFISKEVDPILDKISAHGIHSLTERERKILEKARAKMARR